MYTKSRKFQAGCMASLFQTPPWASMAILPPHNLAQQQGGVTREVVGSANHPLAMRYSSFDGTAAAAAAKDPMNPMNAPLYQVCVFPNGICQAFYVYIMNR